MSNSAKTFYLHYDGKKTEDEILKPLPKVKPELIKKVEGGLFDTEVQNKVFWGDNLFVLNHLLHQDSLKGKVKLVYIDPPFATKQSFKNSDDDHAYDDLLHGGEYLEFLRERLVHLRELLSNEGSIYVHLDGKMAFPVKIIMDEIFGSRNFRNWITRKKSSYKNSTSKRYGNIQDYILFYSKSENYTWNQPYQKNGGVYSFEQRFPKVEIETGRRYALVPIHAAGIRNGATGSAWRGNLPPKGKHWQVTPEKLDEFDAKGEIHWSKNGNPRRKVYADQDKGVVVQDIWLEYPDAINQNTLVTNYPTEKNPELLKRIIQTSSNPNDLVLDCFAGSGTTLSVANELGRNWIGIDTGKTSIDTILKRLGGRNKADPHFNKPAAFSVFKI